MNQETKLRQAEGKALSFGTSVSIGLRQSFRLRSRARRIAGWTQFAAASAARTLCRVDLRHVVHDAARENRRTWTYRIQPSVVHRPYARIDNGLVRSAPFNDLDATPTQLRWSPIPIPRQPTDFVEGIVTLGGNGDVATQIGMAMHVYAANRSMSDRYFYNADGEMLIVPQQGRARFVTELGILDASPGEIAVIPRGLRLARRSAGRTVARLYLRELRPAAAAARTRTARLERTRQFPRFSEPRRRLRRHSSAPASWWRNSKAIYGPRTWIIRRSTSSPGMEISRRTNTIWRALWWSAR